MKIELNFIFFLTVFMLIPPILLFYVLFNLFCFSVTVGIPIIFINPTAELGIIPFTLNLTIWETSLNWIFLFGLIIWIFSAALFLLSNIIERDFKNRALQFGIIGCFLPNLAFIGDVLLYGMIELTIIPFLAILSLGIISALVGIYIKISD